MPEIKVEMRLNRNGGYDPDDSLKKPRWTLEITDDSSRLRVLEIEMTDADFAGLLSSSGATAAANLLDRTMLPHVGMVDWHAAIMLSTLFDNAASYSTQGNEDESRARSILERRGLIAEAGGTTLSARRVRDGINVVVRGYAPTEDEAAAQAVQAAVVLERMVGNLGWSTVSKSTRANPTPDSLKRDRERARLLAD